MAPIVFKGYTARELDLQYNARAAVPGCEAIFEDWRARSADYRERHACVLDIPYGPGDGERLDLFLPDPSNLAGAPVHMFIHGGYWRAMDKSVFSFLAEALATRGALVAVVNYGLCPVVTMDEITRQMQAACEWLWRHCAEYRGDSDAIHVSGHSAGGQQTGMLMAADWPSISSDLPKDLIKSGVAVSGIFDLEPMLYIPLNDDLKLDHKSARRNSPIHFSPAAGAPLSIVLGGDESDEFHRQSTFFAETWRKHGAKVEYLELTGLNHFTAVDRMNDPDNPLTAIMLGHMGLSGN